MSWAQGRLFGYDLETDGPDPTDARIITATVIGLGGGQDPDPHRWLLQTERPIPEGASKIHGISTDHANQHGVERELAIEEIATLLQAIFITNTPVIAFNAAYDFTVLDRECRRVGVPTLTDRLGRVPSPVIDPMVIDKRVSRRKGSRTLSATCQFYEIDLGNAHDATADAVGAARVAYKLAVRHPQIGNADLVELHEWQTAWRMEQQTSLEAFHKSQGKASGDYDGSWPLRPVAAVTS